MALLLHTGRRTPVSDPRRPLRIVAATDALADKWEQLAPGIFRRHRDGIGRIVLTRGGTA